MLILMFLILLVLLYATGLLPGVMKFISGVMALVVITAMSMIYGWEMVIGSGVVVALVAIGLVWLTIESMTNGRQTRLSPADKNNLEKQLKSVNRKQGSKRADKA